MSTKTAPAPKDSIKAKLAKGAAAIRAAKASSKPQNASKAASKANTAKKTPGDSTGETKELPLAVVVESDKPIATIVKNRLSISEDGRSIELDPKTPIGEYVRLIDHAVAEEEKSQWILGALVNQGREIYGESYATLMASTGRPISTLKTYAHVERQFPPDLRLLPFSQCKVLAKVTDLEKKRAIVNEAVKSAEAGHPLTVKEIQVKADKAKPKAKRNAKKSPATPAKKELQLSPPEKENYDELEDAASKLDHWIERVPFVAEMSSGQTASLRDKGERIVKFFQSLNQ